ncbi:MAG: hypothetical protein KF817_05705 [Phycisphaeraceae bacterium]|nr:hypothetical protein [Phycisphaeraceae bacterium]
MTACLSATSRAVSQTPPPSHHLIDLGRISTAPGAQSRGLAINGSGHVVGFVHVDFEIPGRGIVPVPRAFFWTPWDVTFAGVLYAAGPLHVLRHEGEEGSLMPWASVARDINDQSFITGAVSADDRLSTPHYGEAFVWAPVAGLFSPDPPAWTIQRMQVLSFQGGSPAWSDAWAISETSGDDLRVVGILANPRCGSGIDVPPRAFVWESHTRGETRLDSPHQQIPDTIAMAVPAPYIAAGNGGRVGGGALDACEINFLLCQWRRFPSSTIGIGQMSVPYTEPLPGSRGVAWLGGQGGWQPWMTQLPFFFNAPPDIRDTLQFIRGMAGADTYAVGGAAAETTIPGFTHYSCREVPVFWLDPVQTTPQVLPVPFTLGLPDQGYANAINDFLASPEGRLIVGRNIEMEAAVRWSSTGGAPWAYEDLNDPALWFADLSACGWSALREAFDVNNGDCVVTFEDLALVIANYGTCSQGLMMGPGEMELLHIWLESGGAAAISSGLLGEAELDECLADAAGLDAVFSLYAALAAAQAEEVVE